MNISEALKEIQSERRSVGFDTYDITVKQLVDMVAEKAIHVAPDYQRRFVWDQVRQSQLIESVFLGIPVPNLFMATNEDSSWDVVDGLQRLTTILNFVSLDLASPPGKPLILKGMEKIPSLNGASFDDLPSNLKLSFMTRPLRITVLNDNSDFQVRFDLFERLNTGGIILHDQEIRNCVFQGRFNHFLKECAAAENFNFCVKRTDKSGRGNVEELALKFFAYLEMRENFKHSVKNFLNDYMESKSKSFNNEPALREIFDRTFQTLRQSLPQGVVRASRPNSTPLVLFEAVSVGVADALLAGHQIDAQKLLAVMESEELKAVTTGATNSLPKLNARINLVSAAVV